MGDDMMSGYEVGPERLSLQSPAPPIPMHEGEREGEHIYERFGGRDVSASAALEVPAQLLAHFQNQASKHDLRYRLDLTVDEPLNWAAVHELHRLTRIHPEEGWDFFRCQVRMVLEDGGIIYRPLDLMAEDVGVMLEAVERHEQEHQSITRSLPWGLTDHEFLPKLDQHVPRWAGSISYGPALEQARAVARWSGMRLGSMQNSPRQILSISEATMLTQAHVIRVDPEQVEVLPEWESPQEAVEFALDAQLPFDQVYLDFEGLGGIAPHAGIDGLGRQITIRGALMFRKPDSDALVVAPVGWPDGLDMTRSPDVTPWTPYETPGWFIFERDVVRRPNGEVVRVGDLPIQLDLTGDTGSVAIAINTSYCAGGYDEDDGQDITDEQLLPGQAVIPHPKATLQVYFGTNELAEALIWWSNMIWVLTAKALAALSIVEAEEVILVDAPEEKRDIKRAIKRGWPIAQKVVIRPATRRRDGERAAPSGEEARYSHRFWVRGRHNHFPLGTRMATARPDLVRPCPRKDPATNCGFCRRVWQKAHIKGPDDKPLVLKTLVRHKDKKEVA